MSPFLREISPSCPSKANIAVYSSTSGSEGGGGGGGGATDRLGGEGAAREVVADV